MNTVNEPIRSSLSLLLFLFICICSSNISAQVTEAFTGETVGSQVFSEGAVAFSTAGAGAGDFMVASCLSCGSNGFGDDDYLEAASTSGNAGEILLTSGGAFILSDLDIWLAMSADGFPSPDDGSVTFRGTLFGGGTLDAVIMVIHGGNWKNISFSGTALDGQNLTKVEVILAGGFQYVAIDDFRFTQLDPAAVNVTIDDITLSEGNLGNTAFQFTVTRSNDNSTFSVTATSADGSASSTTDYTALPATLVNFTASSGMLTKTVTINVSGDFDPESDEDFFVNLTLPTNGATILDPQGKGTILDDDTVCETFEDEAMAGLTAFGENGIDFSTTGELVTGFFAGGGSGASSYYLESDIASQPHAAGSVGEIQITTADKVFEALQVDLWLSTDADANDSEIGDVTFTGTLAAGGTVSAVITTTGTGGSWSPNLSFASTPLDGALLTALEVSLPTGGGYVAIDNFKFSAFDNSLVLVSIDNVCMNEGDMGTSNFTFTVSRSLTTTAFDVTVQSALGISNPATPGTDYTAFGPVTLNFAMNGSASKTVDVVVNGDVLSEFPETFLMNLTNATNGAIIASGQGLGTIKDDDTVCETFEDEAMAGLTAFSQGGVSFSSNMELVTGFFAGGGSTGSDYYLESDNANVPHAAGSVGVITVTTANTGIKLLRVDAWLSDDMDINDSEIGTIRFIGTLAAGGTMMADLTTTETGGSWTENLSFSGTDLDGAILTAVDVVLTGTSNYVALDNICFEPVTLCDFPDITNVTASPSEICNGGMTTLTVTGTLDSATNWHWYTVSCGGTPAGTGTSIMVSPTITTTYYVRGEGGCVGTTATCNMVEVTVVPDPTIMATGAATICSGGVAILSSSTSGGTGTCGYQWESSETSASMGFTPIMGADMGSYVSGPLTATTWYRVIRDCDGAGCDDQTSNAVEITVFPDPTITASGATTICTGGTAMLSSTTMGGTGTCTYQWESSTTSAMAGFAPIPLATSDTYMTSALTDTTWYRVIRSCDGSACDDATSNAVEVSVINDADISVTKTDGVTSAIPGQSITYTIVVSNAGPCVDPSVTLTDVFPVTLTTNYTSMAAGGAMGNTAVGAGDLNETLNMPVGSSVTYTVIAMIDANATGTLSNTATATASVTDPTPSNNAATDDDTVLDPQADISITKDDGVTSAIPGQSVTYTIVVANAGPSDDPAVVVTDMFPGSLTASYTSVAAGGATGNTDDSGDLSESLSMPAGSSVTYTVTAIIDPGATGTLLNTATATASIMDPDLDNNSATDDDTELTPQADISITKDDGIMTAVPGQDMITYTIVVSNAGPSDDPSVMVSDVFPAELTGISYTSVAADGATGNTAAGSGDLSETLSMPAGSSVTYTASAGIDPGARGTLSNTATAAASVTDPDAGNNTDMDANTVLIPEVDISIVAMDTPDPVSAGSGISNLTHTVTVANAGPSHATGVGISEILTLPPGVTIAAITASAGTYAPPNGSPGTWTIADLPAGSDETLTIGLTVSLSAAPGTDVITSTTTLAAVNETDTDAANDMAVESTTISPCVVPPAAGSITGPVTLCPSLENVQYSIAPLPGATSYDWSFMDGSGSATINGNGNATVSISFDGTYTGGTIAVVAIYPCGSSDPTTLVINQGSEAFCELATCLGENQNITITDAILAQMGSLDVYKSYNRIESDATIEALRTIIFKAGTEIILHPPFNVELGATFIAEIESCLETISNE